MSYLAQLQIAWVFLKDWLGRVFGSGSEFYTVAPGYTEGYEK